MAHAWPQWLMTCASTVLWLVASVAHSAPGVAVSPASVGVGVGQEFDLSITANAELPALSCYAITVSFDETRLELVSAQEGDLFAGAGLPTFFSQETNGADDAWTNCVLGFGTSVAAPGELVRVRFKALKDGPADVILADVVLRDVNRMSVAGVEWSHGLVTAGATATPPAALAGVLRMTAVPNPSSGAVRLGLELTQGKLGIDPAELLRVGSVSLFDLSGRRIRQLAPGASEIVWDGRDAQGRRVASGSYLAVFEHPGDLRVVTKLVRFE